MKYKNYRNPHTNDSRIYSFDDLCNMLFGDVVKRKKEILGQYKTIGVPTEQDLQSSENVVYVEAYTRDDGIEVKAHYRSKPGCRGIAPDDLDDNQNSGNQNKNQDAPSSQYGDDNPIITILSAITDLVLSQVAPEYRKIAQSVLGIITSAFQNIFSGIPDGSNSDDGELTGGASSVDEINNQSSDTKKQGEQFTMPLEGKITSDFGKRIDPVTGQEAYHNGWDIAVPVGTPIKAITDGVVYFAGEDKGGYGNFVVINHNIGNAPITSEYGHMSKWVVSSGQKVKKGDIIGYSGNTGKSTGSHLHITIREGVYRGRGVNPKKYLQH